MDDNHYDDIIRIALHQAEDLCNFSRPDRSDDTGWDHWHDRHFGRVLEEIDQFHPELSVYEAKEISEICQEVESDVRYGDILGI